MLDFEHCYRAAESRDGRFDGWFIIGVTSTGIYCRPSCPAVTPKRTNVRFYPSAAAAQRAGFRACLRCRPDAAPGSPEWNVRADVVGRAMRLIADGVVDRDGVPGLARRLAYTERHLNRMLVAEVGAGPLALARAQRAQTARILIETTDLPFGEIAFAAGFGSIRQFNDTIREVYAAAPGRLREVAHRRGAHLTNAAEDNGWTTVSLRLAYRPPIEVTTLFDFLAVRAVPGMEAADGAYRRTLRLAHGGGIATLAPSDGYIDATLRLADLRDLAPAVARCRRLLDLDADPVAVDAVLAGDPALAADVTAAPGVRLPRTVDGFELACRAVIGQQVSVAGARRTLSRVVAALGEPLAHPDGPLTHLFPTPDAFAGAPDSALPMPATRQRTLRMLGEAVAGGGVTLDGGADADELAAALRDIPGIGPWTLGYITMRALGDPDVPLTTDLGVRRGAARLGLPDTAAPLADHARAWRPWRSYAMQRLWRHA